MLLELNQAKLFQYRELTRASECQTNKNTKKTHLCNQHHAWRKRGRQINKRWVQKSTSEINIGGV